MVNVYEVVEYRHWEHKHTGQRVSIHGSIPWTREQDKTDWHVVCSGFTVYDKRRGTYGICRPPWPTRSEAQAWVDGEHARLEECRKWYAK